MSVNSRTHRAPQFEHTEQKKTNKCWNNDDFSWFFSFFPVRNVAFCHFLFPLCLRQDQECIKQIYEKITHLYDRIVKAHENVDNVLESIAIWGKEPLYQRKENNSSNSLLDIDDRVATCKNRSYEVSTSKKLIEYTMEENYRLLFDLPRLVRQKECGKNRLKKTIIRQFGRHQATDKIRRMSSLVCHARTHVTSCRLVDLLVNATGKKQMKY